MNRLRSIVRTISQVFAAIAAILLIVLMAIIVADVIRRAITGKSITGGVEIAPLLLLSAVMLGLGYAEQTSTHVRTSMVTTRLGLKARLIFRSLGGIAGTFVLLWISWVSLDRGLVAFNDKDVTPGFVAIQTWPARMLVPVGFLLFAIHLAFKVYDDLSALRTGGPDPREVPEEIEGIQA